ncbi:MAG: VWA domain-containing protein [Acidimicrobiales bacterium]|nr:VWA domain-containing protein [Acidimicrobiales bacterium]
MLERDELLHQLSPEPGALDDDALGAACRDDLDAALVALTRLGGGSDRALRELARRYAARVVIDLAREGRRIRPGVGKIATRPADHAGDLDLDTAIPALADARALGELVDRDRLRVRAWTRRDDAFTLLVDRSGSMAGERIAAAALAGAVIALRAPRDHSIVTFAADAIVVTSQGQQRSVDAEVDDLLALRGHGTTDLALGLRVGLTQLARTGAARRIGVLLSDCEPTAGDDPLPLARCFDRLVVLAPPDAGAEAPRLAAAGGGGCTTLSSPSDVPAALWRLLSE